MKLSSKLFGNDVPAFRTLSGIIVVFGVLLVVSIWVGLFFKVQSEREFEINYAIRETGNFSRAVAEHMERTIVSADQMLLLLKIQYERQGNAMDMNDFKRRGGFWNPTFILMGVADETGSWMLSNQEPHVYLNLQDREHVKVHLKQDTGKIFISKPLIGRASGKWSINMSRRINKPDGSYGGCAIVAVNPYYFTGFYKQINLGLNSSVTLIGKDGVVRARQSNDDEEVGQNLENSPLMEEVAKGDSGHFITVSRIDGVKRIYSFCTLREQPFYVVIGLDEQEVLKAWKERAVGDCEIAVVFTIAISLFMVLLLKAIARQKRSKMELKNELHERILMQQELVVAKEAAEAASLAKSEFLANMSHEIRTPMNPILGLTDILLETSLVPEQKEMLKTVRNAGQSLLNIINDVLDFSKIESGKMVIEEVPFNLVEFTEEIVELAAWKAKDKGLSVQTFIDPAIPKAFCGDPLRLKQVLLNLASNAVKFTTKGEIDIRVMLQEQQGQQNICFTVKDTGIGISLEESKKLFQPFIQADGSTTRKYGGTGLGLSICKRLVELMGGTIGVESIAGAGSSFYFTIPMKHCVLPEIEISKNKPVEAPNSVDTQKIEAIVPNVVVKDKGVNTILLVEDNAANQYLANLLLKKLGYEVTLAINGREAVTMAQAETFDVILMDCQMPEMDGFEATRLIREAQRQTGIHVPIIAMTANAVVGDKEKCLEVGMDDYISKPIKGKLLQQMLLRWVSKKEEA